MPESAAKHDAICITGVGLAACLGLDAETVWSRVRRGECGIGSMAALEQPLPSGKDGGQAPDLPEAFHPDLPREARYLRWTIDTALRSASIDLSSIDASRVSLMLGTTLHGMRAGGAFLRSNDYAKLGTFLAGDTVALATRGLAIGGSRVTTCSACSSSLGAIAMAVTLLKTGEADLVIAGGYDTISEYVYAGFNALRLVSDAPLRPFTRGRVGMKVAEGYGIVILERAADVTQRGRSPIAIVAGWGESADAFHLTKPQPEGVGALAAMRQALARAAIAPSELDLVAAHATGTPDNDLAESAALTSLLGAASRDVSVVGFKSHLGHTLGGAGAVELILSALAIRDRVVPPTANVDPTSIEYDALRVTHGTEQPRDVRWTLNTSLGFGGANSCVVLRAPDVYSTPTAARSDRIVDSLHHPQERCVNRKRSDRTAVGVRSSIETPNLVRERAEVVISGIGVVIPTAIGNDAFAEMLRDNRTTNRRTIDDAEFEHLMNARRTRRMSPYVKLSLCAATLACRVARMADSPELLRGASAILATTHGSAAYSYDYYAQIVREGIDAANPMLFAEGVPNAAAAQLSLMLGLTGACQTIIGTTTAGLDALRLAALRIASGASERLIVCAAEEPHFTLDAAYARCTPYASDRPMLSCAGAAAFVLESASAAGERGAEPLGSIERSASSSDLRGLVRASGWPIDNVNDMPVSLGGHLFSVEPLLTIAARLLAEDGTQEAFSVAAVDRTGPATALRIRRKNVAQPVTTADVARASGA